MYICISIYIICIFKPFLLLVSVSAFWLVYRDLAFVRFALSPPSKMLTPRSLSPLPSLRSVQCLELRCRIFFLYLFIYMILLSSRRGLEVRRPANHPYRVVCIVTSRIRCIYVLSTRTYKYFLYSSFLVYHTYSTSLYVLPVQEPYEYRTRLVIQYYEY